MINEYIALLEDIGINLNNKQLLQFEKYFELLVEWNNKINLTSITEKTEVYTKHFYDSICPAKFFEFSNQTLLDVGSGAGFPSIPLKIVFPEMKITIIDALKKRINFLEILCKELDIDVELIHGRAEEFDKKNSFDIVTARAVANLRMLSELCIPFVRKNGYFIALKGPKYKEELASCYNAFDTLNGQVEDVQVYDVMGENRTYLKIRKVEESSEKYPRRFSKIKSKPL